MSLTETQSAVPFKAALAAAAEATERTLDALIPALPGEAGDAKLVAAMRYAVLGGGKRLRAFLVIETARLFGVEGDGPLRAAASVECLHGYSLVHDDMPCMDDDDLRRGKPTVHKAFDEATAVLAGDALQTAAFEFLVDPATHPSAVVRCALIAALAQASGAAGMVGGQAIDLAAESAPDRFPVEEVARLQSMKTGALLAFSVEAGALLGEASDADLDRLRAYARDLGLAFQIADDLLDLEGDEALAGKRLGKDADAGKATFVDLYGADGARTRARDLIDEAGARLEPYGAKAALLAEAARFVVERSY
ncbi:MAG: polyprenyl synthetase family protein [Pseudomonadota bacterium]